MAKFIDIVQDKIWAIHSGKLEEINAFIEKRLDNPDFLGEVAAKQQHNSHLEPHARYENIDGVAVISVDGPISKRFNLMQALCGGVSTELLKSTVAKALEDDQVNAIVLDIDSPGGAVDGTKEAADFIYSSRGRKPIIAYGDGMMCSAAYWIGSAADAIVTNETALIGHIGVAMTHYDLSERNKAEGIAITEIYAGEYKRISSSEKPLSEAGKAHLQGMVNDIYCIFVDSVAKNRGISQEAALAMANGREYLGNKALKIGLADYIGTLETAIQMASERSNKRMDITTLKNEHPDLYAQLIEKGKAEAKVENTSAIEAAVKAERARATEILEARGDAEATLEAVKNGTAPGEAYKAFYIAEKSRKTMTLSVLASEAPLPVKSSEPADTQTKTYHSEIDRLVAGGMKRSEAVLKVNKEQPSLYQKYINK